MNNLIFRSCACNRNMAALGKWHPPVTGGFSTQRASHVKSVSMSLSRHVATPIESWSPTSHSLHVRLYHRSASLIPSWSSTIQAILGPYTQSPPSRTLQSTHIRRSAHREAKTWLTDWKLPWHIFVEAEDYREFAELDLAKATTLRRRGFPTLPATVCGYLQVLAVSR